MCAGLGVVKDRRTDDGERQLGVMSVMFGIAGAVAGRRMQDGVGMVLPDASLAAQQIRCAALLEIDPYRSAIFKIILA
jgi:hypothetical protein